MARPCGDCVDPSVVGCQCSSDSSDTIARTGSGAPDDPFVYTLIIDDSAGTNILEDGDDGAYAIPRERLAGEWSAEFGGDVFGTGDAPDYYDVFADGETQKTFDKLFGSSVTKLVADFYITHRKGVAATSNAQVRYAIRIDDSTDFDSWPFQLDTPNGDDTSKDVSGFFNNITGIGAGSHTAELRYRMDSGDGVEWLDGYAWGLKIWEVPVGVET